MNTADATFASDLAKILPDRVIGPMEPRYLEEPRSRVAGLGAYVARPSTVAEVSQIVRFCWERRVGIIPYGGGTGLVQGQLMSTGVPPLILSLERMAAVRAIHADEGVVTVEAGAILADVQAVASAAQRLFPLTLASQGSARIGGLLSTNAGGVTVLRYGNARDLCLGIEAVLPDGSVFNDLKRLRKDNTGYHLRGLLIGAEGTLGVITAANLRLFPIPAAVGTAFIVVPSAEAALALLAMAQARMAGCVSVFELIAQQGLLFLDETLPDIRQPFALRPDWMVLIEVGLPQGIDASEALAGLYAEAQAKGLALDGIIAQSATQAKEFWKLREALPEGNRRIGAIVSHDISLPLSLVPEFLAKAPGVVARLGDFRINCFGHLGDGNLHYNVFPPRGERAVDYRSKAGAIQEAVHDLVVLLGGSISAEHGIGRSKVDELERYGDPAKLTAMRAIKKALDPHGIMNPGAVLKG